jgi:5-methylcytosine-specific restriction endonuclease McrA
VKGLGHSEGQAYRRVKAAKLLEARPDLAERIATGQTTIATMAQVQTHFDRTKTSPEQRRLIIDETIHLSKRDCEAKLVDLSGDNAPEKREQIKRESSKHSRVSLNISDKLMKKLERIRNLKGHNDVSTYEKLLDVMADDFIKRHDPLMKVQRRENVAPEVKVESKLVHSCPVKSASRKHIPAQVKRKVFTKADHRCEKCGSVHALQIDHIRPVCHGGESGPSNLRILCRACNQREAIRKIGGRQMGLYF